jgi:putative DNA primase/helicase
MSFDAIRSAFESRGVIRPRGDASFTARCPAHDDANASLSVSVGSDGRVLARCFAGCTFDAIADGLGLPRSSWSPPRDDRPRDIPRELSHGNLAGYLRTKVWDIRDPATKAIVARHARFERPRLDRPKPDKVCLWYHPDGTASTKANPVEPRRLPLYGAHDLPETGVVVVCEGEKAADAVRAAGIAAVGTVTGASGVPAAESLAVLAGRDVVLWPDNDDPGRTHMARLAQALPSVPRLVTWDDAPPGGDAADCRTISAVVTAARPLAAATHGDECDEPHTDLGIARRFLLRHGADFRAAGGRWLRWGDTHWMRGADAHAITAVAAVARSVSVAAGGDEITAKAARKQEGSSRIAGALTLAAAHEPCRASIEAFDRHPHLVAARNCVIDLRTGIALPPSRGDMLSRSVPWDYDPSARAPRWEQFVSEVCADRDDLAGFLRRFAGYCLTGYVSEHALALLTGGGRNGKSTFVETLMHVFGDEFAGPAAPGLLLASKMERHPTEIMDLHGRRLVVASEVPKHGAFSEERVKWLTGGDMVKARAMRADFVSFRPTHKFILCANHLPTVKDPTEGFWRRVRVVPFDVDFRGREERGLPERLRGEAPGILAWLVRAAVEWRTVGLGEPVVISQATAEYRSDEDVLGRFLDQWMPGSTEERPAAVILAAYKAWCEQEGEPEPRSAKALAADLQALGWRKRRIGRGILWSRAGAAPEPPRTPSAVKEDDSFAFGGYDDPGYIAEPD